MFAAIFKFGRLLLGARGDFRALHLSYRRRSTRGSIGATSASRWSSGATRTRQ